MKAKLFLLVALAIVTLSVNAQLTKEKPFKIGVGAMIGLPTGDASEVFNLTYGFDVLGEYTVAPSFAVTLSAGYVDFSKKSEFKNDLDYLGIKVKTGMIPVLAGIKYHFSEKFYGSVQAGLSFFTESDAGNAFTFAPGIGYKLSEKFDLMLKYQSASKDGGTSSFLGLRAGLSF